ncbi:STAS domain-containing protein [Endothiovibrio diazotrophicus]
MSTPYPTDLEPTTGLCRIRLDGRLDALSAGSVQDALMALVDEGERRILVDLSTIAFLSSAGIRSLLIVHKELHRAGGELILLGAGELIRDVLQTAGMTRLFTLIAAPDELIARQTEENDATPGATTAEGISLRVETREAAPGELRPIGDHRPLARAGYREQDVHAESLKTGTYAAGLAAAGERFAEYSRLFGEAVVIDGNFFVQPAVPNPRVDYVLREWSGELGKLRFLHGFSFGGEFRHRVQFEDREQPIDLERLRRVLFRVSDADLLGVVLVAESRGHRGMALRRPPLAGALTEGDGSIFDAERFADWFDFPVEDGESGLLLAATGIMAREPGRLPAALAELLPQESALHLHALITGKGHLSHRVGDLERELERLIAHQSPEQVCHLLPTTTLRAGLVGLIKLEGAK